MADLFPEIKARMRVARAYERWAERKPWCWLPARVRPVVFQRFFAEKKVREIDG